MSIPGGRSRAGQHRSPARFFLDSRISAEMAALSHLGSKREALFPWISGQDAGLIATASGKRRLLADEGDVLWRGQAGTGGYRERRAIASSPGQGRLIARLLRGRSSPRLRPAYSMAVFGALEAGLATAKLARSDRSFLYSMTAISSVAWPGWRRGVPVRWQFTKFEITPTISG